MSHEGIKIFFLTLWKLKNKGYEIFNHTFSVRYIYNINYISVYRVHTLFSSLTTLSIQLAQGSLANKKNNLFEALKKNPKINVATKLEGEGRGGLRP